MKDYDIIVIGAGNGGLTAAASLVNKGKKVLLLERHNIPGGCATSFCRGRFEFEVALHQLSGVGTPEKPGPLRSTLERLGVIDKLELIPMDDLFRLVIPGQLDITLRPDRADVISELQNRFPKEKQAIEDFFDLIYNFFTQVISVMYLNDPEATPEKYPLYFKYALKDSKTVIDEYIQDPFLKTILSPYWTYIGIPPGKMAFTELAAMYFAFIEFIPFHIKGGSQTLSNAMADQIIERGGEIRFNCGVKKIIIKDNQIKGVITDNDEEISANWVVSNASKLATFVDLIDSEHVPQITANELKQSTLSQSAFTVYLGLECEPEAIGMTATTNFLFPHTDMEAVYERMKYRDITDEDALVLSCYNLADKSFSPPGTCQVAIVTLKYGDTWLSVPPSQYADEKYRVADAMISVAEKTFPNIKKYIEEIEIATPLTHLRYLNHPKGSVYGFEHFIKNSEIFIPNISHIKGLYGAGGFYGLCGFQTTVDSGRLTASKLLKDMGT
ncbi:MAG: NAD(P)/FAD-dependent oxidoreductase [Deltaproteobacteria bacterium]|nr:NAD(P)/FAD-dependent oxidoreductase [Deltaproteobacteria bacterium]